MSEDRSRREFLRSLARGGLLLGLSGVAAVLGVRAAGCKTQTRCTACGAAPVCPLRTRQEKKP